MGRSRHHKVEFFRKHPTCCFCGGVAPATTEDHVPSRALFDGKVWPDGFNFPACERCNGATRNDEQLAAMICRIGKMDTSADDNAHNLRLMHGVNNNFPGLLDEMQLGPTQKRRWLRDKGIALEPGESTRDFGMFSVTDNRVQSAMQQFGRKLLLALFYRHTGTIFPHEGSIAFRWFSNTNLDEIAPIVRTITPGLTMPGRTNTSLGEQFFYRFGVTDTKRATAFLAAFNESAAVLGVMFAYEPQIEPLPVGAVLRAFDWTTNAAPVAGALTDF